MLAVAACSYVLGLRNLWGAAGRARGVGVVAAAAFLAALALLALVVGEAVERYTSASFAAHMLQHQLLMLIVAPMLVVGRPLATWSWALPVRWRSRIAGVFAHPAWRTPWRALTSPLGAALAQVILLAIWHAPPAFDAVAGHPWIHATQHASFLAPALAFWWALLAARRRKRFAAIIAALFMMMLATGAIGALLTFASHPLYASYAGGPDALADQQLGGLLMWIPGGMLTVALAMVVIHDALAPPTSGHVDRVDVPQKLA